MTFREQLRTQTPLIGTLLTLYSPDVAEILSRAGFDWLFLDLEHSAMGPNEAQQLLQAIGERTATLVRVESRDERGIRKALDIGATGIIVPQVNSRADAERVVALAKYPPDGRRSVGLGRATNYGNAFPDYLARANRETVVVVQIEHIDALQEIEAIAAVQGIDALFVGPYDLSGSIGKPGMVDSAEVVEAIARVLAVANANKLAVGIFAATAEGAQKHLDEGFSLIAVATDGLLLGRGAASALSQLKR